MGSELPDPKVCIVIEADQKRARNYLLSLIYDSQWSQQDNNVTQESDLTFPTQFDVLQVSSRNIRFVHLPADIDIVKALEYQVFLL